MNERVQEGETRASAMTSRWAVILILAMSAGLWVVLRDSGEDSDPSTRNVIGRHPERVRSVVFSSNGRLLGSVGGDGSMILWDADDGRIQHTFPRHGDGAYCLAFSPDGSRLAVGNIDGSITLSDVAADAESMTFPSHTATVTAVAFSPDGGSLVTGSFDQTIRIRDLVKGRVRCVLHGHDRTINAVAFSPLGKILATAQRRGPGLALGAGRSLVATAYEANRAQLTHPHNGLLTRWPDPGDGEHRWDNWTVGCRHGPSARDREPR